MQMPDFSPCRYRPQLTICPRASATRSKTLPPRVSMSSSLQVDQSEEAARPLCTEDVARARDRAGRWDAQDEARRRDGAGRWRDRRRGTGRPAPAAPPRAHPRVAVATPASPASCGYAHPSLGGDAVPPQPLQAARVSSRLNVRTRSGARRARRRHLGGDYGDRAAAIPTTATERLPARQWWRRWRGRRSGRRRRRGRLRQGRLPRCSRRPRAPPRAPSRGQDRGGRGGRGLGPLCARTCEKFEEFVRMCTVTVMAYGAAEGGSDLLVVVLRALTARIGRSGDPQIDHIPP